MSYPVPSYKRIAALEAENAALREDKARLEYLIASGFYCYGNSGLGCKSVVTWDKETDSEKVRWCKINLGPDEYFDDARDAIDAARKEA